MLELNQLSSMVAAQRYNDVGSIKYESEFVDGLRKTTEEMMDVVEMVLVGKCESGIYETINEMGISQSVYQVQICIYYLSRRHQF